MNSIKKLGSVLVLALSAAILSAAAPTIRFISYSDAGATRTITIGIGNRSTNYFYGLYRSSVVNGTYALTGTNFVGNGGEVILQDVVSLGDSFHFYRANQEDGFLAWANIGTLGGSTDPCPGDYIGYGVYGLPAPTWGWHFDPAYSSHVLTDPFRSDTHIHWLSDTGEDEGCGGSTISLTSFIGTRIRFTLYFNNGRPTTAYPIRMIGWLPLP